MSLRARLITGLLVLAAVGLVALAAITYAEQRSFLFDRADDQVHAAQPIVDRSLDQSGANVPGSGEAAEAPFAHVYRMQDGRLVWWRCYEDTAMLHRARGVVFP